MGMSTPTLRAALGSPALLQNSAALLPLGSVLCAGSAGFIPFEQVPDTVTPPGGSTFEFRTRRESIASSLSLDLSLHRRARAGLQRAWRRTRFDKARGFDPVSSPSVGPGRLGPGLWLCPCLCFRPRPRPCLRPRLCPRPRGLAIGLRGARGPWLRGSTAPRGRPGGSGRPVGPPTVPGQ
jgi:hypothetical protein